MSYFDSAIPKITKQVNTFACGKRKKSNFMNYKSYPLKLYTEFHPRSFQTPGGWHPVDILSFEGWKNKLRSTRSMLYIYFKFKKNIYMLQSERINISHVSFVYGTDRFLFWKCTNFHMICNFSPRQNMNFFLCRRCWYTGEKFLLSLAVEPVEHLWIFMLSAGIQHEIPWWKIRHFTLFFCSQDWHFKNLLYMHMKFL